MNVFDPDLIFSQPPGGVEIITAGHVFVHTGSLVISDPGFGSDVSVHPLLQKVPAGSHPVELAILKSPDDTRIALARVVLSGRPGADWQLARFDEPPSPPDPRRRHRVSLVNVDFAIVGFCDLAAYQLLGPSNPETGEGAIPGSLLYGTDRPSTCTWRDYHPAPGDPRNVVVISSGGDGSFPCFLGFSEDGAMSRVLVDFGLIDIGLDALLKPPPAPTLEERIAHYQGLGLVGAALVNALRREFPDFPISLLWNRISAQPPAHGA